MPAVQQSDSYIPSTDWGFKSWLQNFSGLIEADPNRYGLDASDAAIILGFYDSYTAAFETIQAPLTRNASTIAQRMRSRPQPSVRCACTPR